MAIKFGKKVKGLGPHVLRQANDAKIFFHDELQRRRRSQRNNFCNAGLSVLCSGVQAGKATNRVTDHGVAIVSVCCSSNGFGVFFDVKQSGGCHAVSWCIQGDKLVFFCTQIPHEFAPSPGIGFPAVSQ
ncbi:MAG: hypothetical protein U0V54_10860 [Saprospiraceae bacterium]